MVIKGDTRSLDNGSNSLNRLLGMVFLGVLSALQWNNLTRKGWCLHKSCFEMRWFRSQGLC